MIANFDPHFYIKYNGNMIFECEYLQQNIRCHDENDALSLIHQQYLIKFKGNHDIILGSVLCRFGVKEYLVIHFN